ncbi:hypothetical protein [Carnimonas nigrificans]|uniref:hypothetical protein n=1 Tax=Carnimonas nigrificans TaxID=64323 RepID=UPI0004711EFA|nr:hypothetical protein [Carnimonas nigrificans]
MTVSHHKDQTPSSRLTTEQIIECTDSAAAEAHLKAGDPIGYTEEDTPEGHVILEYPSGKRELVRVDFTPEGAVTRIVAHLPLRHETA